MKRVSDSTTIGEARRAGRYGDTELVHLNKAEVALLEGMASPYGLTINPRTGEREAFLPFLLSALPALLPGMGASLAGATGLGMLANPLVLSAIGSGLGTAIETGDLGKGIMAGLGGAALGGLGGMIGGAGKAAASAAASGATKTAADIGSSVASQASRSMAPAVSNGLGMMQSSLIGAPGAMIVANHQANMPSLTSERDKRREAAIDRAQQENFLPARSITPPGAGHRAGFDPENYWFSSNRGIRGYAEGGPVIGPGDGMADSIPASINGNEPAALSDGEFVVPADVVAGLGNGSTRAGYERLMALVDQVRQVKTGKAEQPPRI